MLLLIASRHPPVSGLEHDCLGTAVGVLAGQAGLDPPARVFRFPQAGRKLIRPGAIVAMNRRKLCET